MSNTVKDTQDALLAAIDYLSANAAEQVKADKTVTAIVKSCVDATTGQYSLKYNGGKIYAYATNDASYKENQSVYVLVPESDFTKKKIIVGLAALASNDDVSSVISSIASDYNVSTSNAFALSDGCKYPVGLNSYLKSDGGVLYIDDGDADGVVTGVSSVSLTVDDERFKESVADADMLMLRGKFRTYLPREHRMSTVAEYGVTVTLEYNLPEDESDDATREVSYTLSSREMSGNPFQFASESTQYAMFEFDKENFKSVKSVTVFSRDFVEENDTRRAEEYGDDIFISDIELLGMTKIAAVSSDGMYRLRRQMLSGSLVFSATSSEDSQIRFGEQLLKSNTTDLSSSAMYYWFVSDPTIVKKTSAGYDIRGGLGWRLLSSAGQSSMITLIKSNNPAYQTEYKCSCVYKDTVVLTDTFTVTNMSSKCDVELTSDIGTKFSFDRGTPKITCTANPLPDNVSYVWSKTSRNGTFSALLSESEANEELKVVEAAINDKDDDSYTYADLVDARNAVVAAKGVVKDGNTITVPMSSVDSSVVVKCSVMTQKTADSARYSVGSASITLRNDGEVEQGTCSVVIQNGVQVFQYSEGGQSPCMEEVNKDPQETLPLKALLYDISGSKVPEKEYTVSWGFPKSDTLIVWPKSTLDVAENDALGNHRNDGRIYFSGDGTTECRFSIKDDYDYSAVYNQVECIVTYHGEEFSQSTSFTFNKVGDNGTNGTDVVAIIQPLLSGQEDDYMFAVEEKVNEGALSVVSNRYISSDLRAPTLELELYQSGHKIELDESVKVKWSVQNSSVNYGSGGTKHVFPLSFTGDSGTLEYEEKQDDENDGRRHLVVKGQVKYDGKTYYAYRGVPYIKRQNNYVGRINLYKQLCLKDVVYNSDGSYPQYNKNQGICIEMDEPFNMAVKCLGGNNYEKDSALRIQSVGDDGGTVLGISASVEAAKITDDNGAAVYRALAKLSPIKDYSGEYTNNCVSCELSVGEGETSKTVATVYMPVNMTLNRYSLSSLNKWDGNKVDINEDGGYVLAPQIGAGKKDDSNRFTGILMGIEKTYGSDEQIGLLGYHEGQRSIFMDAETGNTTLGLRDDDNDGKQARIELVPGGQSHIGSWYFDSERLYNISHDNKTVPFAYDKGNDAKRKIVEVDDRWRQPDQNGGFSYGDVGVIVGADPSYISLKGRTLAGKQDVDVGDSGAVIKEGDSFELEIDPNKASIFNIYRHYNGGTNEAPVYRKTPIVGINKRGQFYTNAVEDGNSSMTIGPVGAFGQAAADRRYFGSDFTYNEECVFKFFIDGQDKDERGNTKTDTPLHFSSSKNLKNEYVRPIHLHGNEVTLYATPALGDNSCINTSPNRISISKDAADIKIGTYEKKKPEVEGQVGLPLLFEENNVALFHMDKTSVKTKSSGTIDLSAEKDITQGSRANININAASNVSVKASLSEDETSGSKLALTSQSADMLSNGAISITQGKAYADGKIELRNKTSDDKEVYVQLAEKQAYIGREDKSFLNLNQATSGVSELQSGAGLNIKAGIEDTGKLTIEQTGAEGIKILSKATKDDKKETTITIVPDASNTGSITMSTGNGSLVVGEHIDAKDEDGEFNGVKVHPGISSSYATFVYDKDSMANQNSGYALLVKGDTNLLGNINLSGNVGVHGGEIYADNGIKFNCPVTVKTSSSRTALSVEGGAISATGEDANGWSIAGNSAYLNNQLTADTVIARSSLTTPSATIGGVSLNGTDLTSFKNVVTKSKDYVTTDYVDKTFTSSDKVIWNGINSAVSAAPFPSDDKNVEAVSLALKALIQSFRNIFTYQE